MNAHLSSTYRAMECEFEIQHVKRQKLQKTLTVKMLMPVKSASPSKRTQEPHMRALDYYHRVSQILRLLRTLSPKQRAQN